MLEVAACRKYHDHLIEKGLSTNRALWAVIDCATIMLSLHKGWWIRCGSMADDTQENVPDSMIEIPWEKSDPRCLAWIYSDLMNVETKKKTAAIYTPESIVKFMVRSSLLLSIKDSCGVDIEVIPEDRNVALSALRALSLLTIVDPCVGCGLFLYEAWLQMCDLEDALTMVVNPKKFNQKRVISLSQLHGVDINPDAIEISKRLLQFAWHSKRR